jgi:hypothetical protein
MTAGHGKASQARKSSEHDIDYEHQESEDDFELHASKKRKLYTSKKSPTKSSVSSSPKSKPTSTKFEKKERPLVNFGKNPTVIAHSKKKKFLKRPTTSKELKQKEFSMESTETNKVTIPRKNTTPNKEGTGTVPETVLVDENASVTGIKEITDNTDHTEETEVTLPGLNRIYTLEPDTA